MCAYRITMENVFFHCESWLKTFKSYWHRQQRCTGKGIALKPGKLGVKSQLCDA